MRIPDGTRVTWESALKRDHEGHGYHEVYKGTTLALIPADESLRRWQRKYERDPATLVGIIFWAQGKPPTDIARIDRYAVDCDEGCRTVSARTLEEENK